MPGAISYPSCASHIKYSPDETESGYRYICLSRVKWSATSISTSVAAMLTTNSSPFNAYFLIQLIGIECRRPLPGRLVLLVKKKVADNEIIHLGVHKTSVGVLRRHNNRLAPHVEAGVNEQSAAGELFKRVDKQPKPLIGIARYGLDERGVVEVRDRRDIRTDRVNPLGERRVRCKRRRFAAGLDRESTRPKS